MPGLRQPRTGLDEGILIGLGNPLLDFSANVTPDMLKKYGLEADNAILAEEKHLPVFQDLEDNFAPVDLVPGGATLNSIRVAQWLCEKKHVFGYMGCVGSDSNAKRLTQKAEEAGVMFKPQVNTENHTGRCACLITGDGAHRSLIADLSAANHFKPTHFDDKENWAAIEKADYFYIGGFFLTVSPDSIMKVAQHGKETNKYVMMNLSAPFLCQFFADPMMKAMPYVDILFANETECEAFAKQQNFGENLSVKDVALKASKLEKENKNRERMVIFTQGKHCTVVAYQGKVTEYAVPALKDEQVVDTNGAGDSFVGGFLNQFVQGKPIEKCVEAGHSAARYVIQQSGVTLGERISV